ncbi:hypothetical protein [Streptomyces sp. NBC_01190]|uniref:hypothetical protein n=1 Tax=Streptomyces sp. NBC_01190 TaxID=2903767 RepID=UPI00386E7485|nr:hypothetical protein OG519_32355 [Streptomyces sp. NBC_01190]
MTPNRSRHAKESATPSAWRRPAGVHLLYFAIRAVAAAGLAVDAYVHASLAPQYDLVSADISEGDLFRLEAGFAALAALLLLVWRRPITAAFGWLVAAGGLALLLIYRYDNVGAWGPFPNLYEPIWSNDKVVAVVAQAVTIVATTVLLVIEPHPRLRRRRPPRVH